MKTEEATTAPVDAIVRPADEPILFRVSIEDSQPRWGIAKPTDRPKAGRSVTMLDGDLCFGWWYPGDSLEEAVRNLFRPGIVTEIKIASLVIE